ncbi:MAG TPA: glycosyltransferase family 2 protein [Acidimicrobiales bacterium]|nr:glycosyltransferase family 2 protein [Acidimicrobiales bacterium]
MVVAEGRDSGAPAPGDTPEENVPEVAPPVVAVLVTSDPGPWLEDALTALAAQEYPNFSVLVIDDASGEDPTSRVAAILPTAYVRRLATRQGFAKAANQVLEVVEGASLFLFCHDDVAPDPDAVNQLVEEAFRSNAGVVGPKLVDWEAPECLLQVGMAVDKTGVPAPLVERGELDQEQHDAVRDVFVVPGACTLVRADLFAALGGFDPAMDLYGEDLDLCWRAQVAGARVVVAPGARVRHLEAMTQGLRGEPMGERHLREMQRELQLRHRLRAVLKNYGLLHLLRVLPQLLVLNLAELVYGLVAGHRANSRAIVSAWRWNLRHTRELRTARAQLKGQRLLPDSEVRRLQVRGSARFTAFVRGQLATGDRGRAWSVAGLDLTSSLRRRRVPIIAWTAVAVVLIIGTRGLLTGRLPAVGQLAPFPSSPFSFLAHFGRDWRVTGLGGDAPAPAGFGLLGLAGMVTLGAMGLLQKLLVLGAIPFGAAGAYHLGRSLESQRARLVAAVVYLVLPLPYDALARGRWGGLIAYATMPWIIGMLARAGGLAPFGGPRADSRAHVLKLGVVLALVGALVPSMLLLTIVVALALVAGSLLAGELDAAVRALGGAGMSALAAAVLLFPWTLDLVLPGSGWAGITGVALPATRGLDLGEVMRLQTGVLGGGPLGWAVLVAAALPLLIGRGWRLAWAIRLWTVAIFMWALVWTGGRGWLPVPLPSPEVMLAPAAVALAVTVALGLVAFEIDLPGYAFGWRQVASTVAAIAVALSALPVLRGAVDGRWNMPSRDIGQLISWMPAQRSHGDFRVLWLGDPEALPLDGWQLSRGLAYATSWNGSSTAVDLWPGSGQGATQLIDDAVTVARHDETRKLGHLLAPMAIRYVVVPTRMAPNAPGPALPPPPDLAPTLGQQVDLSLLQSDDTLSVYENAAWAPSRTRLPSAAGDASRTGGLASAGEVDLAGVAPVLTKPKSPTHDTGTVPSGQIFISQAADSGWQLKVNGHTAPRRRAFGWANAFTVTSGGKAELRHHTSPARFLAILFELGLWFIALRWLLGAWRERRRARREVASPDVVPVPTAVGA